jgi:hypothetical protein
MTESKVDLPLPLAPWIRRKLPAAISTLNPLINGVSLAMEIVMSRRQSMICVEDLFTGPGIYIALVYLSVLVQVVLETPARSKLCLADFTLSFCQN